MLWRPHQLIRARTNFDFMGKRKLALAVSTLINVLSSPACSSSASNFGIDFEGGICHPGARQTGTIHLVIARHGRCLHVGVRSRCKSSAMPAALIRVQEAGRARRSAANADNVLAAGRQWLVGEPGRPAPVMYEFTAPSVLDAGRLARCREPRRPRPSRTPAAARIGQRRQVEMTPDQRAEWCQQVAINWSRMRSATSTKLRGTESRSRAQDRRRACATASPRRAGDPRCDRDLRLGSASEWQFTRRRRFWWPAAST